MKHGPAREKNPEDNRQRSPAQPDSIPLTHRELEALEAAMQRFDSQPDPPFTRRQLETFKAAVQQYHQEARAVVQPLLDEEVAARMQAWEEKWTGNLPNGVDISSAEIAELESKMSEQRITKHEEQYLRFLRHLRKWNYAQAREDIIRFVEKDFNQGRDSGDQSSSRSSVPQLELVERTRASVSTLVVASLSLSTCNLMSS